MIEAKIIQNEIKVNLNSSEIKTEIVKPNILTEITKNEISVLLQKPIIKVEIWNTAHHHSNKEYLDNVQDHIQESKNFSVAMAIALG